MTKVMVWGEVSGPNSSFQQEIIPPFQWENPSENTQNAEYPPTELPPEVLEMLLQQARQGQIPMEAFPRLSTAGRGLMAGLAVMIILGGVIICRYLSHISGRGVPESTIFLFFGFLGTLAALFMACGYVGSVYLHVAPAICTAVSGFIIMGFLVPQFGLTRRWVIGSGRGDLAKGDSHDTIGGQTRLSGSGRTARHNQQ